MSGPSERRSRPAGNRPAPDVSSDNGYRTSVRRRPVLEVELNGVASVIRGFRTRDLIIQTTGKTPGWRHAVHGWSVQARTAADVVAAAERAGYDIVITGRRATQTAHQEAPATPELTPVDMVAVEGLW